MIIMHGNTVITIHGNTVVMMHGFNTSKLSSPLLILPAPLLYLIQSFCPVSSRHHLGRQGGVK